MDDHGSGGLMTEKEASRYICMSTSWLRNGRCQGRPNQPPYLKVGNSVRYRRCDLDAWIEAHLVHPPAAD